MRLQQIRVRQFRNILDSGDVTVGDDVTCLVGKNESGKTAVLEALYRLKPAYKAVFEELADYPRWLLSEDRKTGSVAKATPIEAVFRLEDDDVEAAEALAGKGVLGDVTTIVLRRQYGQPTPILLLGNVNEAAAVLRLLDDVEVPKSMRGALAKQPTLELLSEQLDELEETLPTMDATVQEAAAAAVQGLRHEVAERFPEGVVQAMRNEIYARTPTFFYFGEYSQLEGRVDLDTLFQGGALTESQQTARSLLRLANADDEALLAQDYEERKSELEAVANRLTREVEKYWTQSKDLSVEMDVEMEATAPGTLRARYLQVRVQDRRHGFTNPFDRRSSGFRWFFSFLSAFNAFENRPERVVILLDEPALTLHARAQADFLRFINERLAPKHQVIYTTHSPFMVEAGHLERVRLVEDKGQELGAVVSTDVLSIDPDTLFPLQAALGYDIAQSMFVGPDNLVVEGTSDFTYLTVLSDFLQEQGREFLDPRWHILPAGGASNIPTFVALLGHRLEITVMVDAGSGTQKVTDLAKAGYLKPNRLITVAEVTAASKADIEDLFDVDDYLKLYNMSEQSSLAAADLPPGDRILARIRSKSGDFHHGGPAEMLLRQRDKVLAAFSAQTLDHFEELVRRINATLT